MNDTINPIDPMFHKMLLVANLYYKDKLSQQQIAQKLNISRPWVSKLLTRAEEVGIVKIEIISPYNENSELEELLRKKYSLKQICISTSVQSSGDPLALAAAQYFLSELKNGDTVGVGWGTSVSRLIAQTPSAVFSDVHVVPLAGSFGNTISHFPNFSALRLSEIIGASACALHTPALCASEEEYRTLLANDGTQKALYQAEHADILLLGIGAFEDSISPQYGVFKEEDINLLKQEKAMGDVALQYFNTAGQKIDIEATKHLIKADIFKASTNARTSIGIAEGLHKVQMIDTALKLKLVNAFFTNEETALALLGL